MALGELNCPSLEYVYRMTWAEFKIRLHAYKRMQKAELYKTREVCYQILVSNWHGKTRPPSKDKYWPIDKTQPVITDKIRQRIKEAQEQYKRDIDGR